MNLRLGKYTINFSFSITKSEDKEPIIIHIDHEKAQREQRQAMDYNKMELLKAYRAAFKAGDTVEATRIRSLMQAN